MNPSHQTAFLAHLERSVPERMQALRLPGAALALLEGGRTVAVRCWGLTAAAQGQPVTESTLFRLASISKSVAAWAVMLLVERGRVDLEAPIDRYLQRWRLPPSGFDRAGVTVRRLLAHTAGISTPGIGRAPHGSTATPLMDGLDCRQHPLNAEQRRYYQRWDLPPDAPITLAHAPGSGHRYANGGFAMLELMVEELTGRAYADFVREEIFEPLGMHGAGYDPLPSALFAQTATPHFEDGSPVQDWEPLSKAAGGLWASIGDLATWAGAELAGPAGAQPGRGVLQPGSIEAMFASQGFATHEPLVGLDFDTGLGHFICEVGGLLNVHHAGGFSGWRSIYSILPAQGLGFCMLINSDGGNALWQPLIQEWSQSLLARH